MMFREIVTFIVGRTGFTLGTTLQAGHRLATAPNRCVLISDSGGGAVVPELPDRVDFLIQAISRGEPNEEEQPREDAWIVYTALHGTAGWNMPTLAGSGSDYIAWTVDALAPPQKIGQDINGRFEFSVNFIFRMAQASCGVGPSGP